MNPEKRFPIPGILDLYPVEPLPAAPRPGNTIYMIFYSVFNTLDFKAVQAAKIGHAFPGFAILPLIHYLPPPYNILLQGLSTLPAADRKKGNNHTGFFRPCFPILY